MGLAVFVKSGERVEVDASRPWLKAADHVRFLGAESVLKEAAEDARRVREAADQDASTVRHRAHEQGFREGLALAAERVAATGLKSAATAQGLQAAIAHAVTAVLREVVDELPARQIYESALRKAAKEVRAQAFVVLKVPPQREAQARQALDALVRNGSFENSVELRIDASLPDHACVMESESGVVSAGLDIQLAAFGSAVAKELARLTAEPPVAGDP